MKAVWKNQVLAESNRTIIIEGNQYFPQDDVAMQYFVPSTLHTHCPWKGQASYFSINVNGDINKDAAWYYLNPKDAARHIKGYVAFWKGVQIS